MHSPSTKPTNLRDLRASGWVSKTVKREIHDNFLRMLRDGEELFPGIVGYDSTVIPEINIALIAGHDMLFLGEKGQAKSRLMRLLVRFLDPEIPYIDVPEAPLHDDPLQPISSVGKRFVASAAGGGSADRLVAAGRPLCRTARAGHQVRRHHRRDRSGRSWPAARACRPKRPCTSA